MAILLLTPIKSATDNNGMFSTENDDIQMAIGEAATTPSQESQVYYSAAY